MGMASMTFPSSLPLPIPPSSARGVPSSGDRSRRVRDEAPEKAVEAFYVLKELIYKHSVPMALKAALDLGIPDILAAAGPGASLTPHQIVEQLPRRSHDAADKVTRIIALLAHKGVFAESQPGTYLLRPERRLRYFVTRTLASGTDFWSYCCVHPHFSTVVHTGLRSQSKLYNTIIAQHYEGFRDVQSCVVDVGGAVGEALAHVVAAHPHIRGISSDATHVVSTAPEIPGAIDGHSSPNSVDVQF